ncbi:MAG: hypothetical protein GX096_01280 [Clostridiales bacterium]|nr:hypothetical protein [Clostridiales bacterium]
MSFWEKIKQTFRSFMNGRHGADQFSMALLWTGLACYLIGSILGSIQGSVIWALLGLVLNIAGFAAYAFTIFRMFSKNNDKRNQENRRYTTLMNKAKTKQKQRKVRFNNRKQYKYFKCPSCKSWLRLPRGKGVVTVTCSRCHNSFTEKA